MIVWCRFHQAKSCKESAQSGNDAAGANQCEADTDAQKAAEEEKAHVTALSARAQKKWDELDTNQNDQLGRDEVCTWPYLC